MHTQLGRAKLPGLKVDGLTEKFKQDGTGADYFRLAAVALTTDPATGLLAPAPGVAHAVSPRFVVKTQRAYNDYRKDPYPHYKSPITRLGNIGAVSLKRLKDCRTHLGCAAAGGSAGG